MGGRREVEIGRVRLFDLEHDMRVSECALGERVAQVVGLVQRQKPLVDLEMRLDEIEGGVRSGWAQKLGGVLAPRWVVRQK